VFATAPVVAVVVGDLHLSDRPPTARAEETEDEWFDAMGQVLLELHDATARHDCPLVIAGDLFDVPKPSPKLIRYAYEHLSSFANPVYAVAGQHDLPNHSQDKLDESGLGVLVATGAVKILTCDPIDRGSHVVMRGAGWGETPYKPVPEAESHQILVWHRYVWQQGHSHPGANESDHVQAVADDLRRLGYSSAIFGDNHSGFVYHTPENDFQVVNGGVAIPRNADFTGYVPCYTLVHDSGQLIRQPFKTKPKWQAWAAAGSTAKDEHAKILRFAEHLAALVGPRTREDFLDELKGYAGRLEEAGVRKQIHSIIARVKEELE
jgi:Calcineurin-like phosphoesterase